MKERKLSVRQIRRILQEEVDWYDEFGRATNDERRIVRGVLNMVLQRVVGDPDSALERRT